MRCDGQGWATERSITVSDETIEGLEEEEPDVEAHAHELGANELGANELGANELGANELGANELGANEL